jgi:anti-anti-sigma factor
MSTAQNPDRPVVHGRIATGFGAAVAQGTAGLRVDVETIADGAIVRPRGPIDHDRTPAFRRELLRLGQGRPGRLVVDLSDVPELCAAAVATLIEALRMAQCNGGLLVLCGLQARVAALLEIVRLDRSVFTISGTVEEAQALPNRRRSGRLKWPAVRSDRGTVLDISAGGMRLRCERRLRGRLSLRLWDDQTDLVLQGRVVRSRRVGPGHYEAGLQFLDPDAEGCRKLAAILAAVRQSLWPSPSSAPVGV